MANTPLLLNQEPHEDLSILYQAMPKGEHEGKLRNSVQTVTALKMNMDTSGEGDLLATYKDTMEEAAATESLYEWEEGYKASFASQAIAQNIESLLQGAGDGIITREEAVARARDFNTIRDEYADRYGSHLANQDQLGSINLDEHRKARNAVMWSMEDKIIDLAASANQLEALDALQDGAGLLAPDQTKDMLDYTNTSVSSFWESPEAMRKEIVAFNSLSPDQQRLVAPEIAQRIWDANDNNTLKSMSMLQLFFHPNAANEINWKVAWDVFDITTFGLIDIIPRVLKTGRGVHRMGGDIDRPDIAAKGGADKLSKGDEVDIPTPPSNDRTNRLQEIERESLDLKGKAANRVGGKRGKRDADGKRLKGGAGVSTGERKALETERKDLEFKLDGILSEAPRKFRQARRNQRKRSKGVGEQVPAGQLRKQEAAQVQTKLDEVNAKLRMDDEARDAEAQLSRLDQERLDLTRGTTKSVGGTTVPRATYTGKQADPDTVTAASILGVDDATAAGMRDPHIKAGTIEEGTSVDGAAAAVIKEEQRTIQAQAAESVEGQLDEIGAFNVNQFSGSSVSEDLSQQWFARKEAELAEDGKYFSSGELVSSEKGSFTVKYKIDGTEQTEVVKWSTDDVGTLNIKETKGFKEFFSKIFSADVRLKEIDNNIVNDLTFGGNLQGKIRNRWLKVYKETDKGLSGDEKRIVDELLLEGDEEGKVFDLATMRGGVDLPSGRQVINSRVIESYYKKRAFFDQLWNVKNATVKAELDFKGMKEAFISNTHRQLSKVVDNRRWSEVSDLDGVWAPQLTTNKSGIMKKEDVGDFKSKGYELVELYRPLNKPNAQGDTQKVLFGLIKREGDAKIKDLPEIVLQPQAGYVPRIREPGLYYVKDTSDPFLRTVRVFDERAKAQSWIASMKAEAKVDGNDLLLKEFADGETNALSKQHESIDAYGGLYTSPRKKTESLKFGEDGTRVPRLSASRASSHYINSIARSMPLNEYRVFTIERFKNTVRQISEKELGPGKSAFAKPDDWTSPMLLPEGSVKRRLEDYREYIKGQFGILSEKEMVANNVFARLAEGVEGTAVGGLKGSLVNLSRSDPVSFLKGVGFHSYLGWFNPRQLWLQAQNAMLVTTLSPKHGALAAFEAVPMSMAVHARKFGYDAKTVAKALKSKKLISDEAKMAQDLDDFWESGMMDSIERVADYDAAISGVGGVTMEKLRTLAKSGLAFYEQGELIARLTAFQTAKRSLGAGSSIEDITREAYRLHMNLQRENAAVWQTNKWTGFGTQFLQVQAKFLESSVTGLVHGRAGGKWSRGEAARALGGQLALYGTIGVPMVEQMVNFAAGQMGVSPQELADSNPTLIEAINEGVTGMMLHQVGLDINASKGANMLALGDTVIADIANVITSVFDPHEQVRPAEILLGPTSQIVNRFGDAAMSFVAGIRSVYYDPTPDTMGFALTNFASDAAAITSTWSNARKAAYIFENQKSLSKSLRKQLGTEDLSGVDTFDIMAKAIGFPLDKEVALRTYTEWNRDNKKDLASTEQAVMELTSKLATGMPQEAYSGHMAAVLAGYSPSEKQRILKKVISRTWTGKSQFDRETRTALRSYLQQHGSLRRPLPIATGE